MASDDDKERIRTSVSIVDLVGAVTTVRKSGRNHMAVCPFHQEKTPSMSLDVARGLYYCHGCHKSGDIFSFVMENQGLNFPEAMEYLASLAGITLTVDPAADRARGRRQALIEATRAAAEFYHRRLMKGDDAGHARSYLRSRGFDGDVATSWKIGYAPGDGEALVRELRSQGIAEKVMVDAGVARRGSGGVYDYFRDRLMFPTADLQGNPVGFGGRILGDGQPKYLNTAETPIYKKSHLLYGLDVARREIQKQGYSVVVEGYTDVIALHAAGIPLAVATNGTALGDDHFDLLRRFADRVVLAFDADAAGGRAALRGDELDIPVRLELDLRVVDMPSGVDPAEMVQTGKGGELEDLILAARPLLQFRIEQELASHDLTEPESRARALKAVAPRIAAVEDTVARNEYVRFTADRMGVGVDAVYDAIGVPRRSKSDQGSADSAPAPARGGPRYRLERMLLHAVLADGGSANQHGVSVEHFTDPGLRSGFELVSSLLADTPVGVPVPLPAAEDDISQALVRLAMEAAAPVPIGDLVRRLRVIDLNTEIDDLRRRVARLPEADQSSSQEMSRLLRLQTEKRDLERDASR